MFQKMQQQKYKKMRQAKDLTIKELATKLNIPKQDITRYNKY